jgi:hypothetical protein
VAVVPVTNSDADDQTGECVLSTTPSAGSQNFGHAVLRIPGQGSSPIGTSTPWNGQIPLIGTATLVVVTTITVSCTGYNWFVHQPGIMAIKVGTVN